MKERRERKRRIRKNKIVVSDKLHRIKLLYLYKWCNFAAGRLEKKELC